MAGQLLTADSGLITTVASSLKTILQVAAPANIRNKIKEVSISFQGVVSTDSPVLCQLMYQTSAGTGGSGVTLQKWDQSNSETLQSSGLSGPSSGPWTGEPTAGAVIRSMMVHPQGRQIFPVYDFQVKGGGRIAVVVTEPGVTTHVCAAEIIFEE